VALKECAGMFHLTISDAGVGFEQEQGQPSAGIGLLSIRERARMIGADVEITSAPLLGTKVELSLPMPILNGVDQIDDGTPPSGV
jgi:signal transduction histidine kinase